MFYVETKEARVKQYDIIRKWQKNGMRATTQNIQVVEVA